MTTVTATPSCLVRAPREGVPLRLFCFHHAGAGASTFRPWLAPLAAAGVAVSALQLPGRENRFLEPAHSRLEPLIDALIPQLAPHLHRPFSLFGHSMGALVAFEVARRLAGSPLLCHLVVSGCAAPPGLPDDYLVWAAGLDRPSLAAAAHRYEGLPRAIVDDADLQELLLPDLETDLRLVAGYRFTPAAALPCAVTLANGRDDWHVRGTVLDGWNDVCRLTPERLWFDGGHFYLLENEDVTRALATIVALHMEVI